MSLDRDLKDWFPDSGSFGDGSDVEFNNFHIEESNGQSQNGELIGVGIGIGVLALMIIVGGVLFYLLQGKERKSQAQGTGTAVGSQMINPSAQQIPVAPPVADNNYQPNYYGQAQPADAQAPVVFGSDMPVVSQSQVQPPPQLGSQSKMPESL